MSAIYLVGEVEGHPTRPDGRRITTNYVDTVDGRFITTASGSVYELMDVDPEYKKYLDEHRPAWDPENPIKLLKR